MTEITLGRHLEGPAGTADELLFSDIPTQWSATVTVWFLDCPGQAAAWRHYILSAVHLRPLAGAPTPYLRYAHMTHEVLLVALDPDLNPVATDEKTWRHLYPVNLAEQIDVPTDADAAEIVHLAAQAVVAGTLWAEPMLSGQVEPWRTVLIKSAAHARGEVHAP